MTLFDEGAAAAVEHLAACERPATGLRTGPVRIELRLRAYPAVLIDGRAVPLALKRGLALLVVLAEFARKVARSTLADLLWPDVAADVARGRLRRLVHETNQALGIAAVVGDVDALWFAGEAVSVASDVESTRCHARNAIATPVRALSSDTLLEAGAHEFLDGFTFGADTFDEWLAQRRSAHQRLVANALQRVGEHLLLGGEGDLATEAAARLVAIDPLADAGHALLLRVHAQRGDLGALESSYLAFAEQLRGELGVRPSPSCEALYEEVRRHVTRPAVGREPAAPRALRLRVAGAWRRAIAAGASARGCRKCSSRSW